MIRTASASQAALTHDYELNGLLADSAGSVDLVDHGGTLGATGYTFGKDQVHTLGADLGSVCTIAIGWRFDTHSGWQRINDFSDLASDNGMCTLDRMYHFYSRALYIPGAVDGANIRLTLSREADVENIYINGVFEVAFIDSGSFANFTGHDANCFIDDFASAQREAGTGFVDCIRVYDTALLPPMPVRGAVDLMLAGLGITGLVARRRLG